ncbi:MAG: GNAT family N-acetyltransferase, partial [Leptospiraceae bacterium]|nr:GNAT family N-acetyltransferase [Leptospiraceae bacterium]
ENTVLIRKANKDDIPDIFKLILELAKFEKLEKEFAASKEDMESQFFGENPKVFSLVADLNGQIIGYAIYFYNYSTFLSKHGIYLEDLYVKQEHRSRGIGKSLLLELKAICEKENLGRFEWAVLNWNTPAKEFYKSIGAHIFEEWQICRISF